MTDVELARALENGKIGNADFKHLFVRAAVQRDSSTIMG